MSELTSPPIDDLVAAFQIEGWPVRGRLVRLGAAIDEILTRHAYPDPIANLLGETCALAALVGASLKFEGRLIVQAQGDGPVAYVVADYDTTGGLRGVILQVKDDCVIVRIQPDNIKLEFVKSSISAVTTDEAKS